MKPATSSSGLPALLLLAACATAPDDAPSSSPPQHAVEPPAPSRQAVAFEAVIVVAGEGESRSYLLRAVSPVMQFESTDRFWMERDHAASFRVTLQDQEDGLFRFEACDIPARRLRFGDGERVILSRIGHIPWLDDDRQPEPGASDVAPWPTPRTR